MKTFSEISMLEFPPEVRQRGLQYYRENRVVLLSDDETLITASVRGQHLYDVEISIFTDDMGTTVSGLCTCPYYEEYGCCKHIWAVMLATDAAHSRKLPNDTVYEGNLPSGDMSGSHVVPGYSRLKILPGREKAGKNEKSWEKALRQLDSETRYYAQEEERPPKRQGAEMSIRFEIRFSEPPFHVTPVIRQRKKNGDWGVWKNLGVYQKLSGLTDEEFLLITALRGMSADRYARYYSSMGYVEMTREQGMHLLPRLCATGKLYALSRAREKGPMVWDGDVPWRYAQHFMRDENGDCLFMSVLERGEERMHPTQALFLLQDWLITKDGRIGVIDFERPSDKNWMDYSLMHKDLVIPNEEAPAFLSALLNRRNLPPLRLAPDLDFVKMSEAPGLHLAILKPSLENSRALPVRVIFQYGEQNIPAWPARHALPSNDTSVTHLRNASAEARAMARLHELGAQSSFYMDRGDAHYTIPSAQMRDIVAALLAEGWKVTAEAKIYRPAGRMSVSVKSGIDWFELEAQCDYGEQQAALPALLEAARNRQGWVRLSDGTFGMLPEEWLKKWKAIAALGEAEGETIRFTQAQAGLLDVWLAEQPDVNIDEKFRQVREELSRFKAIEPCHEPSGFQGELRAYQREGLGWLLFLERFGLGGCLADDMGLGKTVQVLALLEKHRMVRKKEKRPPSLVVVPRSLIFNWLREAAQFTPALRMLDHTGIDRSLAKGWEKKTDVVITTYGTLRRDIGMLKELEFDCVILDESQAIKNAAALTTKAVRLLRARQRLAMSGTPVENHLGELWSLMEFLNPGLLGRASGFEKTLARDPDSEQRAFLARAMRPFILRRTKAQVAKDLPERQEDTLYCELSPAQRRHYNEIREHYRQSLLAKVAEKGLNRSKIQVLEALLRLRQAACHPALIDPDCRTKDCAKFESLLPRLQELTEEGHKSLVFSQFTGFLALLRRELDELGVRYEYLDGKTRDRQTCVDHFQQSADVPLFLISLKAGGLGLNLTAADYVFLLDPWWNPAVEAQAIDRAHRIGQVNKVMAYRLIAKDTVEEKVLALQKQKKELADAILNEDNALIRNMTREDLELLLS